MKNRYFILIIFLLLLPNVKALDFCNETEEYKNYMQLSEEERRSVIAPIRCQETIDSATENTEMKSKVINMTSTFLKSSVSDSYYKSPYVTPVKNQYDDGTCWAFSAIGTVEGNYLKNGHGTIDLSEAHMAYTLLGQLYSDSEGQRNKLNYNTSGGLITFAPSYFFNYQGELTEDEWAYVDPSLPVINSSEYKQGRHIVSLDSYKLDNLESNKACTNDEITIIKSLILEHGSVQGTMYSKGALYREGKYYKATTADNSSANHAVTIVGWDDNMSGSKFGASRNGAWIVKNSWGTDLFDQGFFYISYEDNFICQLIASYSGVSDDVYTNSYKSSEMVGITDYVVDPHMYYASKFTRTTDSPEQIEKVSFATSTSGKYKVYLSKDNNLDNINNWILLGTGNNTNLGIDSIKVNNTFVTGTQYTIIVEYDNSAKGSSQALLYTCSDDELTQNLDFKSGVNYKSNNLTVWNDMYYTTSSKKCAPNIYVYTSEYKDGISTITENNTTYNGETATISINREDTVNVSEIKILNSNSDITDDFTISYNSEDDKIIVQNTNKRSGTFKLKVIDSTDEYKMIPITFEEKLEIKPNIQTVSKVDDLLIVSVNRNETLTPSSLLERIKITNSNYKMYDSKGTETTSSKLDTGGRVVLNNTTYYIIILGDVTQDGLINSSDLLKIVKHLKKTTTLNKYQLKAAEVTKDEIINSSDLLKIVKFLKGKSTF